MKNDSRARRAYTPQEIAGWITRYRDSDLGLGAFAEQHGLALPSWAVEISLPAGPVVRFSAAATPVLMSAVVQALRRPC